MQISPSLSYQVQTTSTPRTGKTSCPKLICYKEVSYASTGHFLTFLKLGPATKLRELVATRRLPVVVLNDEARRNLQIQVFHPRWSCKKKKTVPSSIPSYKKVVSYLVLSSQKLAMNNDTTMHNKPSQKIKVNN